ncbi:MAG TPA: hypothetical protein DC017_16480, partial [Candidatus Wallbacteria bacterium]|nr:hypothetical protein [Candidatus Wallbacteria bacterium]
AQTAQQLKLKAGFNFVSFTIVPSITLTEFKTQNTSIEDIYLFSAAAGGFLSFGDSTLTSIGAGKGYIIKSTADATIDLSGTAISTVNNINLKAGFNLVGFSKNPEITLTCSQLMARSISIKGIYSWSAAAGSFVAVVRNALTGAIEQLDGSDPVITAGRSYFINMNSDETLNYDGSSVTVTGGTAPVNPALADLTISGFAKKAIIALNTSGVAKGGETEAVGVLPASVNGPAKMIMNFDPVKSGMKDRYFANRAPSRQTGVRTRPIITENTLIYTFKTSEEDGSGGIITKDLATTKVYGTASSKCLIFLDDAVATTYDWNSVGKNFDEVVYPKMANAFGVPTDIDANGKVVILYYDMGVKEISTYGYFMSDDLSLGSDGNEMEVFYMNIKFQIETGSTATADPLDPDMIRTLSHEFQHLINYGQRVMIKKLNGMDTWIDEGMAESAEQIVGGTPGTSRINTIKEDNSNKIKNGAPMCVWMGDDESYALAYTFMQYCKNHAKDGEAMFKLLIGDTNGDYRAVEKIMKEQNSEFTDFASVMAGYRIANMVNASSGIYGYGAENAVFNFSAAAYAPTSVDGLKLAPGGCVYIYPSDADVSSFTPSGQGTNIRFIRVNK